MTQPQDETISILAQALRNRFQIMAGDRIGVLGDVNVMRAVYYALWALGACAVPLDAGTLNNTETLNAANAIYVIADERRLARAVQAVEPGVHDLVGARFVREVIQFGGDAGVVFPYIDAPAQTDPVSFLAQRALIDQAGNEAGNEALLLYLYFIGQVQEYRYSVAELREIAGRTKTGKPRPKIAVVAFYPIVETLIASLVQG